MSILGPHVHRIDPIIGSLGGVHFWWYGLRYTVGFLTAHLFIRRRQRQLSLPLRAVYTLSLLLAGGVLLGGRVVEVVFYEWPFYREHACLIPAFWLGGMATHGLLVGGLLGVWGFCRLHGKFVLTVTDALAIPAAVILGVGRIGNFIDGQIVGSVTTVWWAVKFPDADGFRHPVVLYDGLKNLLLIPILLYLGKRHLPAGVLTGTFLFLYAFLRIFLDVFREYPTTLLGFVLGLVLNILMATLGVALIFVRLGIRRYPVDAPVAHASMTDDQSVPAGVGWRRVAFAVLLLFSLVLPSDWTQDVPARYGNRHAGLVYSTLYPHIATSALNPPPRDHAQHALGPTSPPTR